MCISYANKQNTFHKTSVALKRALDPGRRRAQNSYIYKDKGAMRISNRVGQEVGRCFLNPKPLNALPAASRIEQPVWRAAQRRARNA